jgi:hypothetical protein
MINHLGPKKPSQTGGQGADLNLVPTLRIPCKWVQRFTMLEGWHVFSGYAIPTINLPEAKCTAVLVIQLFLTNYIQAHDNCLQVLPHINLDL